MTRRDSRRRPHRSRSAKGGFFVSSSGRRYPRWRSHHPADNWDRLAPPSSPQVSDTTRTGFLILTLPGRNPFRDARDRGLPGKLLLLSIAAALLLIRILF